MTVALSGTAMAVPLGLVAVGSAETKMLVLGLVCFVGLPWLTAHALFCVLLMGVARRLGDDVLGQHLLAWLAASALAPVVQALVALAGRSFSGGLHDPGDFVLGLLVRTDCFAFLLALALGWWFYALLGRLYDLT
jgi:hypothetical protein